DLFQAAIYHAANGFPVMEMMHGVWDSAETRTSLASDKEASRVFLPEGRAPRLGEIFRNPGLARAYRLIADGGSAAFYRGPIAEAIIKTTRKYEGTLKASDLAGYSSEWVEPIATTYRGWTVYELPPNGQGIAALQMLNVMENFPLGDYRPQSAEAMHLQIESMKAAYADLKYVRDTRFGAVPVTGLLSKEYAKRRASLVDPAKAKCDYQTGDPAASGDTTYLSVVDKEGNIASLIQSISSAWGSGIAVEGMGFLLHNRGASFEFDQSMANVLVPGKRPRHTIIPAFMEKDDVRIGFGIMGGPNQPLAHAQFVSNLVDFGMNIQAALDAPRFTKREIGGCNLYVEGRIPTEVRQALSGMGHQISVLEDFHGWMGRGQAVLRDSATGTSYGASSPRGDGAAIPEPRDYFGGGK
ncbi:MAG: gamma-glutamyltransferase family protein, partial [Bryobacteraceae bacterium]